MSHKCDQRDCPGYPCGMPHAGSSTCPYCPGGLHWEPATKPKKSRVCGSPLATRPINYQVGAMYQEIAGRDDLWAVTTAELNEQHERIAALESSLRESRAAGKMEGLRAAMVRLEEAEKGSRKDAEAWLITTCVTVHEREHGPLLADCPHPICRALSELAKTIEQKEEYGTNS